jgi:hypothetical protein
MQRDFQKEAAGKFCETDALGQETKVVVRIGAEPDRGFDNPLGMLTG